MVRRKILAKFLASLGLDYVHIPQTSESNGLDYTLSDWHPAVEQLQVIATAHKPNSKNV